MKKQIRKKLDALVAEKRTVIVTRHSRSRDGAFLSYTSFTGVIDSLPGSGEYQMADSCSNIWSFSDRAVRTLGSEHGGGYVISLR